MKGDIKEPMSDHATCAYETQLYIFGGLTAKGFANSVVSIVEFNQKTINTYIQSKNQPQLGCKQSILRSPNSSGAHFNPSKANVKLKINDQIITEKKLQ